MCGNKLELLHKQNCKIRNFTTLKHGSYFNTQYSGALIYSLDIYGL